jgi:hypothetical protein
MATHQRDRFVAKVTSAAPVVATRQPPVLVRAPKPIVVGREDELARLQSWYSQGQRRVVFVTGEAGIGKTTVVQTFLNSVQQEGTARVGRGQCIEQYGGGEPYMPLLDALSRLGREPGGEKFSTGPRRPGSRRCPSYWRPKSVRVCRARIRA